MNHTVDRPSVDPAAQGCASHLRACLTRADAHAAEADVALLVRRDDAALADAVAWDTLQRGAVSAPLAGRVLTVKACFDSAGWITHAGSRVLAGAAPAGTDAPLLAALRRLGAVLIAQTNMTEFAYGALGVNSHFGTPTTPLDTRGERVAGGSSSGAAVAVALGIADISLGSDTSGSARIPAAFCGVAGFKPSRGRYPDAGMRYLSTTFDVPGILATSAAACRQVDGALTGRVESPHAAASLRDLCFIVPERFASDGVDGEVCRAFDDWVCRLSALGARIVCKPLACLAEAGAVARAGGIIAAEAFILHRATLEAGRELYDPRVGPRIAAGAQVLAHDYVAALARLQTLAAQYHAELGEAHAVLTPTVPMLPPTIRELDNEDAYLATNARSFRLTEFANRLDLPSISLPGDLHKRRPVGLLMTGRRGDDARLLDAAARIEACLSMT
ncbi:amidase family protein [Paraburkholderia sp. SIMBA_030]|uniref:amidase family protein n=1 Tax=Paraburkholderia sp. SIMBA_030 TaxID=3085773 RepID=UPI00397DD5F7